MEKTIRNQKLAQSLIKAGLDSKFICRATSLSLYELNKVQRNLNEKYPDAA